MERDDLSRPGEPFAPRALLRGGHAQTLAAALLPRRNALPAAEARGFSVGKDADGVTDVQVLCHCHWQAEDRKSTRLNSSHIQKSRMPSSA